MQNICENRKKLEGIVFLDKKDCRIAGVQLNSFYNPQKTHEKNNLFVGAGRRKLRQRSGAISGRCQV
jgi:hypothetical protein